MKKSALIVLVICGCSPAVVPPPQPVVPEIEPVPFTHAWTAREGLTLTPEGGQPSSVLPILTRVEVIGREAEGLRVRCVGCADPVEAVIGESDLLHQPLPPEVAAWGSLAEFALSIRAAAEERSLELLRPVMVPDFSFSLIGPQTPDMAFEVWRSEDLQTLDRLPALLDLGITTRDSVIWAAPPAFLDDLHYRGLRAGFRRGPDGRWEWLFLMSSLR